MLLLVLPAEAFEAVVPVLVVLGLVLVAVQPWINRRINARAVEGAEPRDHWSTIPAVAATGVYGGYFGAAQGILLVGALGITTGEPVHATNAMKNALSAVVNSVAAVVFVVVADVDWLIVAVIGVGSVIGSLDRFQGRAPTSRRPAARVHPRHGHDRAGRVPHAVR